MRVFIFCILVGFSACLDSPSDTPQSTSGVKKITTQVRTGSDGKTVEQRQIEKRLMEDNKPGAIKHLYIISPYSGQVLMYSTVNGKVTSGSKRLTPYSVLASPNSSIGSEYDGFKVDFNGTTKATIEVLQDDGTYGSSEPYIYWWDVQGRYHQHFFTGGQIIHISDQPIPIKSIILNLELQ